MTRRRGFTLLELLIAIAITALVMAMVGGILVSNLEAQEHVSSVLATEKTGYGVLNLIRRDLEGCYCYALGGPAFKGERGSEGSGVADRISFVSTSEAMPDPQTGRRPKLQRIGYRLKADGTGGNSVSLYRRADAYAGNDPLGGSDFTLVASGIKSLQLSYLDPKDRVWHDDEWKETDRVPTAVRIQLELATEQPQGQAQGGFLTNSGTRFQAVIGLPTVAAPPADPDPAAAGQPGAPVPPH